MDHPPAQPPSPPPPGPPGRWRRLLSEALDLVYPPLCPGCEVALLPRAGDGGRVLWCGACARGLAPLTRPFCEICGQPYDGPPDDRFHCANCRGRHFHFAFAAAPYLARGPLRQMIHRFKFGRTLPLRRPLGRLLAGGLMRDERLAGGDWLLVPVPVHPRRLRERGFNQARELAAVAGRLAGLKLRDVLIRDRYTPPQSRLGREQRLANLRGSIHLRPGAAATLAGRRLLLVDDVFTTGSTAEACAAVLARAGPAAVAVLTLARG
jgi:competence protein ComFC